MNINWVISETIAADPMMDFNRLKDIGSLWGSWRTWRACATDNVICHELSDAQNLIQRDFHKQCNFYIPNSNYIALDRPIGVKLYEGNFQHDVDHREEIIAMHLASSTCDIVLLLGFDFQELPPNPDRLIEHRNHNYWSLAYQIIKDTPRVQWLCINHPGKVRKEIANLENFSQDKLSNILS